MVYAEQSDESICLVMMGPERVERQPANARNGQHADVSLMLVPPYRNVTLLLKEKASPCPQCKTSHEMLCIGSEQRLVAPRYRLACVNCGNMGAYGHSISGALQNWNNPSGWRARFSEAIEWILHRRSNPIELLASMRWL